MLAINRTFKRGLTEGFDPKEKATRSMSVDKIDTENRTIELSFSSEAEVERWWGIEILDHSAGSVLLERLNDNGPLIFNHDLDKSLGVIEKAWVDEAGKGRALVRFSRNPFPSEVWNDIQDGILKNVSVGYRIQSYTEEKRDDTFIVRATKWEPYEISIVTAPADTSVGVGRDINEPQKRNEPNKLMNRDQMIAWLSARKITVADDITDAELLRKITDYTPPAPTPPDPGQGQRTIIQVGEDNSAAVVAERARAASIRSLGGEYRLEQAAIDKAVADGVPVGEFRGVVLSTLNARSQAINQINTPVGLSAGDVSKFSLQRLIRAMIDPHNARAREAARHEMEICEAARSLHPNAQGQFVVPMEVLATPFGQRDVVSIKSGSGYTGTVGNTVETNLLTQDYFGILRNKATIMQSSRVITGLVGNYDIPYLAVGAANASWIAAEDDEAEERDIEFAKKSLSPKTVACHGRITRDTIMQSSLDAEYILRSELAEAVAQSIDFAGYYGSGASGIPKGIRNYAGINYKAFAANEPTFAELVDMETKITSANIDPASSRYRFNAALRGYFKTAKKYPAGSDSIMILGDNSEINGYGHDMTNQIAAGQVFFGDHSEVWVGTWGGLDLIVNPYSDDKRGRIRITNFQTVDVQLRRENAFTFGARTTLS